MEQNSKDIVSYLAVQRQADKWDWTQAWELSNRTVNSLLVPPVVTDGSRAADASDFAAYTQAAEKLLKHLVELLKAVSEKLRDGQGDQDVVADSSLTAYLVLLHAQHSSTQLWTTEQTICDADAALRLWMDALGECTVGKLLSRGDSYKSAVFWLFSALVRLPVLSDWKYNPAAVVAFHSIALNVDYLKLCEGEHRILISIALRLVDDFELANMLRGVECLRHIINNVTSADLLQYYSVFVEVLSLLLPRREPSVIRVAVPCALDLFRKMEHRCEEPVRVIYDIPYAWSKSEVFFLALLDAMQWEDQGPITSEFLAGIPPLLAYRPMIAHRFSRRLLIITERYLGFGVDPLHMQHTAINHLALQVIRQFILVTSEAIPLYSDKLCLMLTKKQLSLRHGSEASTSETQLLRDAVDDVLALMKQYDQETYEKFCSVVASCA